MGDADEPGCCRRPDLIVVQREARLRQRRVGGPTRASDVLIVIEFVSPGSRRTEHVAKRSEYADAGIPHYWIVDLDEPVGLLACHLAGEFGYADAGAVTGVHSATAPFPLRLDLDALLQELWVSRSAAFRAPSAVPERGGQRGSPVITAQDRAGPGRSG